MGLGIAPKVKASAKATVGGLDLAPARKVATEFRRLNAESKELDTRLQMVRGELLEIVTEHRNAALHAGKYESSVNVPTDDGSKVSVVYQERYTKSVGLEHADTLKKAFGSNYALFVEERQTIKLREEANLAALKAAAGKNYDAIMALLQVETALVPRKGAYQQVAEAFKRGDATLANDLAEFVEICISSPAVKG